MKFSFQRPYLPLTDALPGKTRAFWHLGNLLLGFALFGGMIWGAVCLLYPEYRWWHVVAATLATDICFYLYWLFCVCHLCEHYLRHYDEGRPNSTLNSLGCCVRCGACWLGPIH